MGNLLSTIKSKLTKSPKLTESPKLTKNFLCVFLLFTTLSSCDLNQGNILLQRNNFATLVEELDNYPNAGEGKLYTDLNNGNSHFIDRAPEADNGAYHVIEIPRGSDLETTLRFPDGRQTRLGKDYKKDIFAEDLTFVVEDLDELLHNTYEIGKVKVEYCNINQVLNPKSHNE